MPAVRIVDIRPAMRNIEVTGMITGMGQEREVDTRFGPARVATATLEDDTGSIRLNLWRQQIDLVKKGDAVRIVNAFTRTFGGQIELNIGKDGSIMVLS